MFNTKLPQILNVKKKKSNICKAQQSEVQFKQGIPVCMLKVRENASKVNAFYIKGDAYGWLFHPSLSSLILLNADVLIGTAAVALREKLRKCNGTLTDIHKLWAITPITYLWTFCSTKTKPYLFKQLLVMFSVNLQPVAMPSSRGFSQPRDRTQVSCIPGEFFTSWATREALLAVYCIPNCFSHSPHFLEGGDPPSYCSYCFYYL